LKDLRVDGKKILQRIFKKTGWEVVDGTDLHQDTNKCFDLVKNVKKPSGSTKRTKFLD